MQLHNRKLSRAHVNQQILASCDFYQETEDWVERLKASCLARKQKHASAVLKSDEHRAQQSLMQQIDTLMDVLNSFAILFNQDVDYESFLTVTLPVLETDFSRKDASISERMRPSYRGRISSRNWSLVLASHMHSIEISLMPANCLLDNSVERRHSRRLEVLQLELRGESVHWTQEGESLARADFTGLSKRVFKELVEAIYSDINSNPEASTEVPSFLRKLEDAAQVKKGSSVHQPTGFELGSAVLDSLNELIEDQLDSCAKEASISASALQSLSELKMQWQELLDLQDFVKMYVVKIDLDKTFEFCPPSRRLKLSVEYLIDSIVRVGANAFKNQRLELAGQACKNLRRLEQFRNRLEPVLCEK